jgi:MurNAc alpha-1-phosphate uridylyltransferase
MLMAAGLGTRLRPFTDIAPKALLPVMGVPCAQFAIDSLVNVGVEKIVANIHHHAELAKAGFARLEYGQTQWSLSDESECLLGSAGGIAKALPHFGGEPFFLLNADVLCDVDLRALANRHRALRERHGVRFTFTVFRSSEGTGKYREIIMDRNTGLIRKLGDFAQGKPYFVGAAVMECDALDGISGTEPAEFVPKILEPAIRDQKAGFFLTEGQWHDVGSPELWGEAHFKLMERLETGKLSPLWRHRLESLNLRIGQNMWVSKRARRNFPTAEWHAPAYFSPDLNRDSSDQSGATHPPREFGPRAVLYGNSNGEGRFGNKISFRGLTRSLDASSSQA